MSPRALVAPLASVLVACGGETADPTAGADARRYTLALVGDAAVTLHPGEGRTLQALLAATEEGPVANARIHFAFLDGDPAGSRVDPTDVLTDDDGVATVRVTAGSAPAAFHLAVTAAQVSAVPVAFAIGVVRLRRSLRVVPTPATSVSEDGAHGSTLAAVAGTVALKVRELDADTGAPIEGDSIAFMLPEVANSHWSAGVSRTAAVKTGAGGKAQAFLVTAQSAEGPWRVVAQSAAGDAQVTFDVTVRGQACRACPPGFECAFGICQPPAGNVCDPDAPACASGQCCDARTLVCREACPMTCSAGTHCQPGPACGEASCVPDEAVPDVSGVWLTRHDFRIHDALPFAVQEIFKALRLMDQTLLGQLTIPGLPGWLQEIINAFVARLLQQYLPGWIQQLIQLSDDFATILGNLRSEGSMRLTRTGDMTRLRGTEVWTRLVFYWLPLCDGEIAGDPAKPPECARIDVLTSDSGFDETAQCKGEVLPSVGVELSPFAATLVKQDSGYLLQVGRRQARLIMGKVLLILYDQLIGIVSGGEFQCIQEATECAPGMGCIVDCDGLGRDIESATGGIVDEATVQALCGRGMRAIGDAVAQALARVWPITADTLDFSGSAGVSGLADDWACEEGGSAGACAARLGKESWDKDLNSADPALRERRDGRWTGDFFFRLERDLPGAWEATRPE
jgi:hypothetical protein